MRIKLVQNNGQAMYSSQSHWHKIQTLKHTWQQWQLLGTNQLNSQFHGHDMTFSAKLGFVYEKHTFT